MRKAGRGRNLDEQLVERTAVVYVFSGTDPEYERNLHFFIETGIQVRVVGSARPAPLCWLGQRMPPPKLQSCAAAEPASG